MKTAKKTVFKTVIGESNLIILSPPSKKTVMGVQTHLADCQPEKHRGGRGTPYDGPPREAPHTIGTFQISGTPCYDRGFKRTDPPYPTLSFSPASSQHFMKRSLSILGRYVRDVLFFSFSVSALPNLRISCNLL